MLFPPPSPAGGTICFILLLVENMSRRKYVPSKKCPSKKCPSKNVPVPLGREPWSSGYGRQLMFERSWVRILAPYTGWTFFTLICCKNCVVCLKRPKINEKEARVGPIFFKTTWTCFRGPLRLEKIGMRLKNGLPT